MTRTLTDEAIEIIDAEFIEDPSPTELICQYLETLEEINEDPHLNQEIRQHLKEAHTWSLMIELQMHLHRTPIN